MQSNGNHYLCHRNEWPMRGFDPNWPFRDAIWRNHDGIWRGNEFRFYGKSTIFAAK